MSSQGPFEPEEIIERAPSEPIEPRGNDQTGKHGSRPRTATVPIDSIIPGDSPRLNGVSPQHVHILGKIDVTLPPILVDRSTMRVIDGMHRLQAAMANGEKSIEVEFFDGPERAAFVQAVKANIAHGLPLSLADRRAAAERILELYPEWSDRMVAASAGLSDKTVASIRRCSTPDAPRLNARIGRDGRARPLNSTVGRWIASELIEEYPHAPLREVARKAGISVATVRDVRERMRRGDAPVPAVLESSSNRRSDAEEHASRDARATTGGGPDAEGSCGELDGVPLLEGLRKDPALRYNEVGRALLRWLDLRIIRTKELDEAAVRIPPHTAVIVARVARRCAAMWERFANELELRSN